MEFDFTSILDRRGRDAIAVDAVGTGFAPGAPKEGFDLIPMWIADMNFPVPPSIQESIIGRVQHPAFGYFIPRKEYFECIQRWQKNHFGVEELPVEAIGYENGVLGGVASALAAVIQPGDPVLVHSPTYIGFLGTLKSGGYRVVTSPLAQDAEGVWRMDYEDMDRKIRENNIRAVIFCSPHNPTGRVWEPEETAAAMAVYEKNGCTVISDEIWADITLDGRKHHPTQESGEWAKQNTVALYAPSKTFNLAGLIGSYHIIYNGELREAVARQSARSHYNDMNVLSMYALLGAYTETGERWLDELRDVLSGNAEFAYSFITENFPGVTLARPQGTYMLYLHCEENCRATGRTMEELLTAGTDVGVAWQDGRPFGDEWAIRMNLALPRARVEEAFRRLKEYVFNK